jgi:hypothetical protein
MQFGGGYYSEFGHTFSTFLGFEVTAVKMLIVVLRVVMPCGLAASSMLVTTYKATRLHILDMNNVL